MRLSLLLALAASCSCSGAWSLPRLFGYSSDTTDAVPSWHPDSLPLTDPAKLRAKRQAYQVYVDGDVSIAVNKGSESETGPWGPWSADGQCSRTCGGGVQKEKRQCGGGQCTGPSVRYVQCSQTECADTGDFRAEQCAARNDQAVSGQYYKWTPYFDPANKESRCQLYCVDNSTNKRYKFAEQVVDGTKCDNKGFDICIGGVCVEVGCDGKLGSEKKLDKCGVCGGKSDSCTTTENIWNGKDLAPGYHDVVTIPAGATSVKITEIRESPNNLALKTPAGDFVLNGNELVQAESDIAAAGTIFEYEEHKKRESLKAAGPLKEPIVVVVYFRPGNSDSSIKYEYSLPLNEDVQYMYKVGDWTPCSVTCGKGVQKRDPYCIDSKANTRVDDDLCEFNNATLPDVEKACVTSDCNAEWFTGEWESCSTSCGSTGEQYRVVYCHQVFKDGKRQTVNDTECKEERPKVKQNCNRFACPEWQAGPWSSCSEKCGDAFQYRSVTCRSEKEGEESKLLAADQCPPDNSLETQRTCNLGPCEGLSFKTTDWKLCSRCNDTVETREVSCVDTQGRAYPLEKCENGTETKPIDERPCATQPPCQYEWTTSEWSKCSTECGHGHQTRRVVCAIHQEGDLEVVSEHHCQGDKPEAKTNCTLEEKCTGTWFASEWSECTEECGGGKWTRKAVCLNYDHKPEPKWCDENEKPVEEDECNVDPCPTCFDGEFGCCPDNVTVATGDFYQGCSNCSLSEFGCCADNVTEATGADGFGCAEYVVTTTLEPVKAENLTAAEEGVEGSGADEETCKLTSANGTEANVECASIQNQTLAEDVDLLESENKTIHCSKTEFGCCPDWYTPAGGPKNEGCDSYVLGACNETQYGCCQDDVTLARGPDFQGCGEPACAGSLYGCCKDRRTIAFGPHYAGCERSSFPCELSTHGCCPDGETAALGANGTGCGENCLVTKFGCCPDGKQAAKGKNNEGCGCEFSKFGCCPDGKAAAKGSAFYGCPQGCAQSQFGCCPDGKQAASGTNNQGCACQYTKFGCCPDGLQTATGPNNENCDDCRFSPFRCCPDGNSKALGPNYQGCPQTTAAPFLIGGTVSPNLIASCQKTFDQGRACPEAGGYKLVWSFDSAVGRCSQFWYGGCDGNDNRFATEDQCKTVCITPPGKGRCYLQKAEGNRHCSANNGQPVVRYHFDFNTKRCAGFWFYGCEGNSNNFESQQECESFCADVEAPTAAPPPTQPQPVHPAEEIRIDSHPAPGHPAAQVPQPAPALLAPQASDAAQVHPAAQAPHGHQADQPQQAPRAHQSHPTAQDQRPPQAQAAPQAPQPAHTNHQSHQPQQSHPQQSHQPQESHQAPHQAPQAPQQQPQQHPAAHGPPLNIEEVCKTRPDQGPCTDYKQRYYFSADTGTCERFQYGGCGGNNNNFGSEEECRMRCNFLVDLGRIRPGQSRRTHPTHPPVHVPLQHAPIVSPPQQQQQHPGFHGHPQPAYPQQQQPQQPIVYPAQQAARVDRSACQEKLKVGTCEGRFKKFYYELATGECMEFDYSGCGGSRNKFSTKQECERTCKESSSQPVQRSSSHVCDQAKNHGVHCRPDLSPAENDRFKQFKFFYNKELGTCTRGHYFGCGGNENRFDSEQACQDTCGKHRSPCDLPAVKGSCEGNQRAFHYNKLAQRCEAFVYSGCQGNSNRFATYEECSETCPARK